MHPSHSSAESGKLKSLPVIRTVVFLLPIPYNVGERSGSR